jgi:hypothetical protein
MWHEYGHPFGPQCVVPQTRTCLLTQNRREPGKMRGAGPTTISAVAGARRTGFPGSF